MKTAQAWAEAGLTALLEHSARFREETRVEEGTTPNDNLTCAFALKELTDDGWKTVEESGRDEEYLKLVFVNPSMKEMAHILETEVEASEYISTPSFTLPERPPGYEFAIAESNGRRLAAVVFFDPVQQCLAVKYELAFRLGPLVTAAVAG